MTKRKDPADLAKHVLHGLDDLLALMYPVMTDAELGALLGCSPASARYRAKQLGLCRPSGWMAEISGRRTKERSIFTPEVEALITYLYADTPTDELADFVGISRSRIWAHAKALGLRKSPDVVVAGARRLAARPDHPMHQFRYGKGHVPANKGIKGYSNPGSVNTQFKKGTRPHTWRPIGSYTTDSDGYLKQKLTETGYPPKDWVFVHRQVWIAAHGPIPDKHVVRFKPGRKTNVLEQITEDALECISMAENARRNHPKNISPEVAKLVQLRAVMTRQINKFSKLNAEHQEAQRE